MRMFLQTLQDQVKALNEAGVSAAFINSALSDNEYFETIRKAKQGLYKIIYVAPERLLTDGFLDLARYVQISMVTVDEAHCISQWGQDFRPSYRKIVDKVYELLKNRGVSVAKYHAGMGQAERKQMQDDFVFDYTRIVVATNAFGMGIDKSNVRFVIHYNMPQSMENYYQEAGRAGRDGLDSKCILLFSPQDIVINRFLLDHKEMTELDQMDRETVEERDRKRLQIMERYCYTTECLRNYILKYFGDS